MTDLARSSAQPAACRVRRGVDIAIALAVLVFVSIIMVLIALAIVFDSPGPVLFSQVRLGRDGRPFHLYKFRKFHHRLDSAGRDLTGKNDPRMTRIGRVLERTKLDELPQLWNILVGDMSVVGPRPESLAFADCFTGPFRYVLDHTPGLLGPNQVMFRNESHYFPADRDPHEFYRAVLFPLKARNDLSYFAQRSLRSDFVWMLRGGLAVFGVFISGECGLDAAILEVSMPETYAVLSDAPAPGNG